MSQLPSNWLDVELSDVAEIIRGVTYKREQATDAQRKGFLPVLRATNITGAALTFDGLVYVPRSNVSNDQLLRPGDVVIASSSGSKEIVGKSGTFAGGSFLGSFGAFCTGIRPTSALCAAFFGYYFQTLSYRKSVSDLAAGSNINNLKTGDLAAQRFPLPPAAEQTRIVAKLEELLTDLDAGVAELNAAQKKLAQYRQSLLKAAVEGALTAEWRTKHTPSETSVQLLARILTERRARWEAKQLAKFKEQGKTPPKDWQKKYPEPVQPDTSGLPELPAGWVWTSLDTLIADGPQNGLYLPGDRYGSGTPMLRIDDYQIGWHRNRAALNLVNVDEAMRNTYALTVGDLVINRVNSMTHLGKSLLVTDVLDGALFESNMMRSGLSAALSREFVAYYLGSEIGRSRLIKDAKWAVNQASINQQDVRCTPVPLPPAAEQVMVAATLREQLGAATEQGLAIKLALKQSTAQRQNILRAAFAGQLVPQDPNEEPASRLLERIRAERAARDAVKKPRGRKTKEPT